MCQHCAHIPYQSAHAPDACPYLRSLYCRFCAGYGHEPSKCALAPSELTTQPHFAEQLIPTHLLKQYNVGTITPIKPLPIQKKQVVLELPDDDKMIREYLFNQGYATVSTRSKELHRQFDEHCQKNNLKWQKIDIF
jgi:hypothetical protein